MYNSQRLIVAQYSTAHLRPWGIKPLSEDGEYKTETMQHMKKIRPQQYILNVMYWATLNKMIAKHDNTEILEQPAVVESVTTDLSSLENPDNMSKYDE